MRRYLILLGSFFTLSLTASIIRSNIGAVNESFSDEQEEGISAKSYVKNGLVALWDGIENVGYGLHDDTAVVWKDLTGHGYDLTVNSGAFGDYFFDASGENSASRVGGIEFAAIEAVVIPVSLNKSMKNIFISGFGANYGSVLGGYATAWACSVTKTPSAKYTYDIINEIPYCIYADNHGAYDNDPILVNNVWIENPTQSALDGYRPGNLTAIGFRVRDNNPTSKYQGFGYVLCIRLYSRKLTSEEIAHNHYIDVERFNIQ